MNNVYLLRLEKKRTVPFETVASERAQTDSVYSETNDSGCYWYIKAVPQAIHVTYQRHQGEEGNPSKHIYIHLHTSMEFINEIMGMHARFMQNVL